MIKFEKFTLDNGLKVIVHQDTTTPIVAINIAYNVGAKDEDNHRTGFAHLFEHLMFSGSVNIPEYDSPLQLVGGSNNAFTSQDYTNYYLTLPVANIETGFWLESDRMLSLAFSEKGLEVQRKVVVEEFKENYLNQPYGDVYLLLSPLIYKHHPYQWMTIGKETSHIEQATLEEVKAFFAKFYHPANAILTVSGDVSLQQIKDLCEKWFAPIPAGVAYVRNLPIEPPQKEARYLEVEREVPQSRIYKAYRMVGRDHKNYYIYDLLSDILGNGESSRLHQKLVKELQLFTNAGAFVMGTIEDGIFIITATLKESTSMEDAEKAIITELQQIAAHTIASTELQKVKNKAETHVVLNSMKGLDIAQGLTYFELLGDANKLNEFSQAIEAVTVAELQSIAQNLFQPTNCSTLYYKAKK